MSLISENHTLEFENVLSFRGNISAMQMNSVIAEVNGIIKKSKAEKVAPMMTTTRGVQVVDGQQMMDIEVLVPLSEKIKVPKEYVLKEKFKITNAVKITHKGNPALMQNSANELMHI